VFGEEWFWGGLERCCREGGGVGDGESDVEEGGSGGGEGGSGFDGGGGVLEKVEAMLERVGALLERVEAVLEKVGAVKTSSAAHSGLSLKCLKSTLSFVSSYFPVMSF
jgi:hypothetical protein